MRKKLFPTTIIPPELYVKRNADYQLREVIQDMGRPGYILVARQMGKTNLLLNAKRTLESENDIFAYIDLSNRFETDRECFRNIIDIILESNPDKLEPVVKEIYSNRERQSLVPHREHVRELRRILSAISGKLVINLDEIDSLTAAKYSDKIFAQIRSAYFERVNYKEFERLGYIISGVAEPSDIIKDKSISPFNIGQKILLGDFTYDEFCSLVEKASLPLSKEAKDRVFYWVNGNPRLTWEVCSELENIIANGVTVSEQVVDKVVSDLYLAKYDRAPVDHIRSLVKSDKELRNAVISIFYGKADVLSDRVKSRLYLAGILGSDFEYGDVRIKNRVIEKSLDANWLSEIEKREGASRSLADDYFNNKKYENAATAYQEVIDRQEVDDNEKSIISFKLGICYYNIGEYHKTLKCFEGSHFDKGGERNLYLDQIYTSGMCHFNLREYESALSCFNEVLNEGQTAFYFQALITKAATLLKTDPVNGRAEALALNELIIKAFESGAQVSETAIAGAFFNVATINEESDKDGSYEYFIKSSQVASDKQKVTPLIAALRVKPESILDLWPSIIGALSTGEVKLDRDKQHSGLELSLSGLSDLINLGMSKSLTQELGQLLLCIRDYCLQDKAKYSEILLEAGLTALGGNRIDVAKYLFTATLLSDRDFSSPTSLFQANKYLSYLDNSKVEVEDNYFKGFQNYVESPDYIDVRLFERRISKCIANGEDEKAAKYCDMILDVEGLEDRATRVKLLTISYLKMRAIGNNDELVEQAQDIKQTINWIIEEDLPAPHISKDTLQSIQKHANSIIISSTPVVQVRQQGKRYGRNEKVKVVYEDGRVAIKKYKLVQESISQGLCKIDDT